MRDRHAPVSVIAVPQRRRMRGPAQPLPVRLSTRVRRTTLRRGRGRVRDGAVRQRRCVY